MLGRTLGNYAVVKKLGEGGMGVVYLARHATLGRFAAIKVLRASLAADQDIVSRFFNEARAVTAIRNPGIVEAYDFGFLEDRTAYIIMEYLDGESLAARMRRGRLPISGTLTIIRAIARGLQAAHEKGIVHRDLKPDNVFLVPDVDLPNGERVKLLDFGIAKLAHGVGNTSHTTTGTVMGTPTYMSPEQCRGSGAVDHRTDLYSLGCVTYELLCGLPPFVAEGPGDVIARHLYFEPASLRSHRSEVAPELEAFVLRLLKKDPKDRYNTAAEVVRALDQWMKATPTQPIPVIAPVPTEMVATLPLLKDTTLKSAASSAHIAKDQLPPAQTTRSRITLLAGAAAAVTLVVLALIFFLRGGGQDDEQAAAGADQAGEPKPQATATATATTPPPPPPAAAPVEPAPVAPDAPDPAPQHAAPVAPDPEPQHAVPIVPAPEHVAPTTTAEATPPAAVPRDGEPAAGDTPAKPAKPAKPTHPPKAPKPDAAPPAGQCTRADFAPVLDAPDPSTAAVNAAWTRLHNCHDLISTEQYNALESELLAKT